MSYLRFRPLRYVRDDDTATTLFAWPVLMVPIWYWAVVRSPIDALEQALLSLTEAHVTEPEHMRELLGIPESMRAMISRSLDNMRSRVYLTEGLQLTESGYKILRDEESLARDYRQGWLLFDQIRGGIFPLVQAGRLSFFKTEYIDQFRPITLTAQVNAPESSHLLRDASNAVAAYNRRLALINALDLDDDTDLGDEQELDLPLTASGGELVEDVKPLSLDLAESHHLLVEVVGRLRPGRQRTELRAYSPFSPWEQDAYLESLMAMPAPPVCDALTLLEQRAKDIARESVFSRLAGSTTEAWEELSQQIRETLGVEVKLPADLVDKLHGCEYELQVAQESYRRGHPFRRETVINGWGSFLEAALKQVSAEIEVWLIPVEWRKLKPTKDDVWPWYVALINRRNRPAALLNLPPGMASNLRKQLVAGLPETYGKIKGSSSRDEIVKVLLASLSVDSVETLPIRSRQFIKAIQATPKLLADLDQSVGLRNDSAHGGQDISQLSPEKFETTVEQMRSSVYDFLRVTFCC